MGAGRILLPQTQRDGAGGTGGVVDLQPVAFVSPVARTRMTRGERGRTAPISPYRGKISAERAAENAASQGPQSVVGAIAGRLRADLRVAGRNCAAVENRVAGRAAPVSNRRCNRMKTHPPTAESRFNGPANIHTPAAAPNPMRAQ